MKAPGLTQARGRRVAKAPLAERREWPKFSGRILLVEDNDVNCAAVFAMLEAYGTGVVRASSGEEALEIAPKQRIDLVLMDCQMSGLDGFETTRRWRAREVERNLGHVPIVAPTANAMHGDRAACLAAGMDDYLSKPFTRDELTGILARWLGAAMQEFPATQVSTLA